MKIHIELDQDDIDGTLRTLRKAGRTDPGRTMIVEMILALVMGPTTPQKASPKATKRRKAKTP